MSSLAPTFLVLLLVSLPAQAVAQTALVDLPRDAVYTRAIEGDPIDQTPWQGFADPALTQLVDAALAANGDLAAAVHRIEQADALALQALSPNLPLLSASVGANVGPGSPLGQPEIPGVELPTTVWSGSALVLANWTFDLAGQRILAFKAGLSDTVAARHDRAQFAVGLGVQVTEAYLDAAASSRQLAVLQRQLGLGRDLLVGIEARYDTGTSTAAAVLQQRRQVEALQGALSPARTTLEVARSRLAVLTARMPGSDPIVTPEALPALLSPPPTGSPADLPAARPDLRAAIARYDAGIHRSSASKAAFAPSFGVNAQGGLQWRRADDEDIENQETWGMGLSLNIPLLNAAVIGGARQSRAAELASRDSLRQQVLAAVGEVEQGLIRREQLAAQLVAQQRQLEAARTAFQVSNDRFAAGLDDYLTLLTSWNSLLADELSEINVRRSLLGADVRLRAALGGSWTRSLHAGERR